MSNWRLAAIIAVCACLGSGGIALALQTVELRIEADGSVELGSAHFTDDTKLQAALTALAAEKPRPHIHVSADSDVRSEKVRAVALILKKSGLIKVGFLTPN